MSWLQAYDFHFHIIPHFLNYYGFNFPISNSLTLWNNIRHLIVYIFFSFISWIIKLDYLTSWFIWYFSIFWFFLDFIVLSLTFAKNVSWNIFPLFHMVIIIEYMVIWIVEMDAANGKLLNPSAAGRSDCLGSTVPRVLTLTLPSGAPIIIQGQKLYQLNEAMHHFPRLIDRQKDKMVFCKADSCGNQLFTYWSDKRRNANIRQNLFNLDKLNWRVLK